MSYRVRMLDPSRPDDTCAGKCALAVMAKAPVAGKVKTRLSPPLTPEQAAELNACFLRDTLENLLAVTRSVPADVVICYTPMGSEEAFYSLMGGEIRLILQRGDGFGERLLHAVEDLLACGYKAVCLIDSDSPTTPRSEYLTAVRALMEPGQRVVLGPSADGGYYLLGMKKSEAKLFEGIAWSESTVARETLQRAEEIGMTVKLLREWYDVDDGASLARLIAELNGCGGSGEGYAAERTRAYVVSRLGYMMGT